MTANKFLAVTIMVLGLFVASEKADAAVVNYSGQTVDMGGVSIGQTGTITSAYGTSLFVNNIQGLLPSNSIITFTYNFGGDLLSGSLNAGSSYSFLLDGDSYNGGALDQAPGDIYYSFGSVNGTPSDSLVMASAQIDAGTDSGMTRITNTSGGVASYASVFTGLITGSGTLTIDYAVTAVPLPAALPLFGAGISALAGFGLWRRKKVSA